METTASAGFQSDALVNALLPVTAFKIKYSRLTMLAKYFDNSFNIFYFNK